MDFYLQVLSPLELYVNIGTFLIINMQFIID